MTFHLSTVRRLACLLLLTGMLTSCGSLWGTDQSFLTSTPNVFWTLDPSTPLPFWTLTPIPPSPTSTPTATPTETPTPAGPTSTGIPPIMYYSQPGDTLLVVAAHFGVDVTDIATPEGITENALLVPNTPLLIPNWMEGMLVTPIQHILPDSEIVYSASAIDFNVEAYVAGQGGYLSTYRQYLTSTGWTSGARAVQSISVESTINPRLLLALIEYQSGWVTGQPGNLARTDYPLGYIDFHYRYLYRQMMWAIEELSVGYYAWRSGKMTELSFPDGTRVRLNPQLNAGSVAIQYFFSKQYNYEQWLQVIDPNNGFLALYTRLFGDPWARAQEVEPLFPPSLTQPDLVLPFEVGRLWSFTGGPHSAWGFAGVLDSDLEAEGALAALDFAPSADETGCSVSDAWVVASASGKVVRSGNGVVVVDLDGDGFEQTGWNLLYMHIASNGRVPLGAWLNFGDHIGHPSCEGGNATGTHVHFARKYNGEWVLAEGPLPFTLSGWVAHDGDKPYKGTLTRGDLVITANLNGMFESQIKRDE